MQNLTRIHRILARATALSLLLVWVALCAGTARAQGWNGESFGSISSDGLRAAQYLLRARGQKIVADGVYGDATELAVRRFQKSQGLKATGNINEATWNRLTVRVRRGSRGDAVRAAQVLLFVAQAAGEAPIKIDGVFGASTEEQMRRVQKLGELKEDGIVGPQTWRQLLDMSVVSGPGYSE